MSKSMAMHAARDSAAQKPMAAAKAAPAKKTPAKKKPLAKGVPKPSPKAAPKAIPRAAGKPAPRKPAATVVAKKEGTKKPDAKKPLAPPTIKKEASTGKKAGVKSLPGKSAVTKSAAPKKSTALAKTLTPHAAVNAATKSVASTASKGLAAQLPPTKNVTKAQKPAATPITASAKAPVPTKVSKHPVENVANPAPVKVGPAKTEPSSNSKPASSPATAKAAPTKTAATAGGAKPQARASAKAPVHMPLPAIPTQAEQASRFADRFAPPKPSNRVLMDAPDPQKSARKDPKLVNAWKSKAGRDLTEAELLAMPDDVYMNDKQLDAFRKRLTDLKDDLLSNAGETTEHLREDTSVVPDPADRATIEEEHALELRTRDRERKLLKKISQSLARIEAGDYGYCDETGEPIGVARLLARPTATLSLEAQQRRELKQKMFGD